MMEGAHSDRELMRYPMWDSQKQTMVERRVFMDGHQETVRPSHSSPSQSFRISPPNQMTGPTGVNDVISQHLQGNLQNSGGIPGRNSGPSRGKR